MWHADSPVTSPSRGGGRTHSNSRADTQQHPTRPGRSQGAGRPAAGPARSSLGCGEATPGPHAWRKCRQAPSAAPPASPAPTCLRASRAAPHTRPFLSGTTLTWDAPGTPSGPRWSPGRGLPAPRTRAPAPCEGACVRGEAAQTTATTPRPSWSGGQAGPGRAGVVPWAGRGSQPCP